MSEKDKIRALRKVIPVSLTDARKLLQIHQDNVAGAIDQWKEDVLCRLIKETGMSRDQGVILLERNHYNYEKVHNIALKETKDLYELTLESSKDLWTVLYRISVVIQERYKISEDTSSLDSLPEPEYKFMLVWNWVNYLELENSCAVARTPEEVMKVLKELSLESFVQAIKKIQSGDLSIEMVEVNFKVESQIGEALRDLMKKEVERKKGIQPPLP